MSVFYDDESVVLAIQRLVPDAAFRLTADGGINWQDSRPLPSETDILAEVERATLSEIKDRALRKINAAYTEAVKPLIREYPEPEPLSWAHQDAEAQAYLAWHSSGAQGDAPATPVLEQILAGRNGDDGKETMLELCQAVERNATAFRQAQVLTGKRQRLVRLVREAESIEEVEAVEWYLTPDGVEYQSEEERAKLTSREEALSHHSALIYQLNAVYDAHVSGLSDDDAISRAEAARDAVRDIIPTLTDPESYDVEIAFRAHLRRPS